MFFHFVAFVDRGIVEQDDARHQVRQVRYLVKKSDHILTPGRPLLSSPDQPAVVA